MTIIRKRLNGGDYHKSMNSVASRQDVTDYSFKLYTFLMSLPNGLVFSSKFAMLSLGWVEAKLGRAKRNLIEAGIISVVKVNKSSYFMYVGDSVYPAVDVVSQWDNYTVTAYFTQCVAEVGSVNDSKGDINEL